MFTVLMFDINASASSGWPNMMMVDELVSALPTYLPYFPYPRSNDEEEGEKEVKADEQQYSKLPCSRKEFEKSVSSSDRISSGIGGRAENQGEMKENPQTCRSPDLFTQWVRPSSMMRYKIS